MKEKERTVSRSSSSINGKSLEFPKQLDRLRSIRVALEDL
jgi:hypothetical protein